MKPLAAHAPSFKQALSSTESLAASASPVTQAERSGLGEMRVLFNAHYVSIWRLLRRLGVREAQVDDAAQEVFWVAARRFSDIQRGREAAFLYGVALRVASQEVQRQRASRLDMNEDAIAWAIDPGEGPEAALSAKQERARLDSVLNAMPQELREVLVLFELEGLEVRAIAELFAIPLGTAASRLRRAREEFSAIAKRLRAEHHSKRARQQP